MLSHDVVSNHSTPIVGSRCPWTPKHLSHMSVLTHLYTMPGFCTRRFLSKIAYLRRSQTQVSRQRRGLCQAGGSAWAFVVMNRRGQPVITSTKVFDVTPESGSTTRSR